MPLGDRTGPMGQGPRTGRALGFCSGYDSPGYTKGVGGGMGRGFKFAGGVSLAGLITGTIRNFPGCSLQVRTMRLRCLSLRLKALSVPRKILKKG
jgi:hypothetical protein